MAYGDSKDPMYPKYTSIVGPELGNIEEDIIESVKEANRNGSSKCSIDAGRLVGLYRYWRALSEGTAIMAGRESDE